MATISARLKQLENALRNAEDLLNQLKGHPKEKDFKNIYEAHQKLVDKSSTQILEIANSVISGALSEKKIQAKKKEIRDLHKDCQEPIDTFSENLKNEIKNFEQFKTFERIKSAYRIIVKEFPDQKNESDTFIKNYLDPKSDKIELFREHETRCKSLLAMAINQKQKLHHTRTKIELREKKVKDSKRLAVDLAAFQVKDSDTLEDIQNTYAKLNQKILTDQSLDIKKIRKNLNSLEHELPPILRQEFTELLAQFEEQSIDELTENYIDFHKRYEDLLNRSNKIKEIEKQEKVFGEELEKLGESLPKLLKKQFELLNFSFNNQLPLDTTLESLEQRSFKLANFQKEYIGLAERKVQIQQIERLEGALEEELKYLGNHLPPLLKNHYDELHKKLTVEKSKRDVVFDFEENLNQIAQFNQEKNDLIELAKEVEVLDKEYDLLKANVHENLKFDFDNERENFLKNLSKDGSVKDKFGLLVKYQEFLKKLHRHAEHIYRSEIALLEKLNDNKCGLLRVEEYEPDLSKPLEQSQYLMMNKKLHYYDKEKNELFQVVYKSSKFILTDKTLYYYNKEKNETTQVLSPEEDMLLIENLQERFATSIKRLSDSQFKTLKAASMPINGEESVVREKSVIEILNFEKERQSNEKKLGKKPIDETLTLEQLKTKYESLNPKLLKIIFKEARKEVEAYLKVVEDKLEVGGEALGKIMTVSGLEKIKNSLKGKKEIYKQFDRYNKSDVILTFNGQFSPKKEKLSRLIDILTKINKKTEFTSNKFFSILYPEAKDIQINKSKAVELDNFFDELDERFNKFERNKQFLENTKSDPNDLAKALILYTDFQAESNKASENKMAIVFLNALIGDEKKDKEITKERLEEILSKKEVAETFNYISNLKYAEKIKTISIFSELEKLKNDFSEQKEITSIDTFAQQALPIICSDKDVLTKKEQLSSLAYRTFEPRGWGLKLFNAIANFFGLKPFKTFRAEMTSTLFKTAYQHELKQAKEGLNDMKPDKAEDSGPKVAL